jgi:hypothetical protein
MLIVVDARWTTSSEDEEGSHRKLESSSRRQKLLFEVIMFFALSDENLPFFSCNLAYIRPRLADVDI